MQSSTKVILVILGLLLAFCCIAAVLSMTGFAVFSIFSADSSVSVQATTQLNGDPIVSATLDREPTAEPLQASTNLPGPAPDLDPTHAPDPTAPSGPAVQDNLGAAQITLQALKEAEIPDNELRELAERLLGIEDIPLVLQDPPVAYQVGDTRQFWATNVDTNHQFQVNTVLRYATDHAYFWIDENVSYDYQDLKLLAETFENEIYPLTRDFFGSEWTPGIDNDPHIYILYVGNLGWYLGGYFSSIDSVHPLAHEYSNAAEVFVFNSDNITLYDEYTYTILAHEFQHMIHWNVDRNETTWLNEGMAELSAWLNGYDVGGKDFVYISNPDVQFTNWAQQVGDATANYGGSFLYTLYFYDRFGDEVTQALVAHPENGMESVDAVFAEWDLNDEDGKPLTANAFFQDWVIANYLGDADVADGRYHYSNYPGAMQAAPTETLSTCDGSWHERTVNQFGVDYIRITCPGVHTLRLEGSAEADVLPVNAHSGEYMWWSNRGDESDMTLTRSFDLSTVSGPVTMQYWTWYDLEADYDYLYVEASEDGQRWEILRTPGGTDEDPTGNSYGWAYNGSSGGWVQEEVDLSAYAGGEVWVRFEYVTDAAVNGEGFLLDDVQILALGYVEDFETGNGGWQGAGFVRIANRLPQSYGLSLLLVGEDGVQVSHQEMAAGNVWDGEIEIGGSLTEAVLVISGQTRFTNQPAEYRFKVD